MPASPLAHSNRREGRVCVSSRVSHVHSVRERRMWVLRDLSVSAARPRAIFLIRPFASRPRHCAIVAYYMYRTCVIGLLITLSNSEPRQSPSRFCNPRSEGKSALSRYCNILLGHCNISKKCHVRRKENTGYPVNIFTHRYMYNIFMTSKIEYYVQIFIIIFIYLSTTEYFIESTHARTLLLYLF